MDFWAVKNYGKMAQLLSSFHQYETPKKTAGWVRKIFGEATLIRFSILAVQDFAAAVTVVQTEITYVIDVEKSKVFQIRLHHEGVGGNGVTRDNPTGQWRIIIIPLVSGLR